MDGGGGPAAAEGAAGALQEHQVIESEGFWGHPGDASMWMWTSLSDSVICGFLCVFSLLMDCVGCEKCRLWGKLQILGLGTALKILFAVEEDGRGPEQVRKAENRRTWEGSLGMRDERGAMWRHVVLPGGEFWRRGTEMLIMVWFTVFYGVFMALSSLLRGTVMKLIGPET